jgi:hypothetical protein
MSEELARYVFLPWIRRGISADMDFTANTNALRTSVPVTLTLSGGHEIQHDMQLYGPGDITGFDHRIVVRTDPKRDVNDFEPNFFPLIELFEPDFPWRYTPIAPTVHNGNKRLRPWIGLIVLRGRKENGKEPEFTEGIYDPNRPLPYINILNPKKSLPDLSQSWAWAHTQVTTVTSDDGNITEQEIEEMLKTEPERVISRLLCPRRLDPGISYQAFVVPLFKSGRLAGLGDDIPVDTALDEGAWVIDENPVDLPYYYKWEFRTGLRGDFEYLVRLLEPRVIDKRVGSRLMDCSKPGYDIPSVHVVNPHEGQPSHALGLEGALKAIDTLSTPWPENTTDNVQPELKELVNLPAEQLEANPGSAPLIVPPIYGCWHSAQKKVHENNYDQKWPATLNLDPRHRTTAGFGTRVVQDQQEDLMAAAWQQIGAIEEANEELRQAQLGTAVTEKILKKNFEKLSLGMFTTISAPIHSQVLIQTEIEEGKPEKITIKHRLRNSLVPPAAVDPAFRRLNAPRGSIRRRQNPDEDPKRNDIVERLNDGDVVAAGDAPQPDGTFGIGDVSDEFRPNWADGWLWKFLKYLPIILLIIAILLFFIMWILDLQGTGLPPGHPITIAAGILLAVAAYIIKRYTIPGNIADNVREDTLVADLVESTKPPADFQSKTGLAPEEFRQIAVPAQQFLNYKPPEPTKPKKVDLEKEMYTPLIEALDPRKSILKRMRNRLRLALDELPQIENEFDQIMAAPKFHRPMYEPLRDISQDLLLPGLEYILQNTLGLLVTNQEFVESYMVGLNHEMARELKWREYPTDQRGSYFRQFWDVSNFIPTTSLTETLRTEAENELNDPLILSEIRKEAESQLKDEGLAFNDQIITARAEKILAEKIIDRVNEKLKERLKDIKPIHQWRKKEGNQFPPTGLGENNNRPIPGKKGEGKVVLLIRGDLLKKYPSTVIYAAIGEWTTDAQGGDIRRPILDQSEANTKHTVFSGTLPPDITFLGFDLTVAEANGSEKKADNKPGWFFVIEERVSETRFGMDAYRDGDALPDPPEPAEWDDLSWGNVKAADALEDSAYFQVAKAPDALSPENMSWDSHAAACARITMQKPVRIAVHADDMIPEVPAET